MGLKAGMVMGALFGMALMAGWKHMMRFRSQKRIAKVKFTSNDVRRIMDRKHNIRNISIMDPTNHGKSTLTSSLVAAAGIIPQEVDGDDEAQTGITIKSTGISLYYKMSGAFLKSFKGERNGNEYLINLIDSPGHMDISSEVTAALRVTDGTLVVVDCVEGVCLQTETVLRQALKERVRPVLIINNMDRYHDGEKAYETLANVILHVNRIIRKYHDPLLDDVQVCPEKGTVAFSAGLHGWAFTLRSFAKRYTSKFGLDESKMVEMLWGMNFFDPATTKWTSKGTGTPTCKRGFVQFCYEPIKQVMNMCMNNQKEQLWRELSKLGVTMKSEEKDFIGEALMKRVMQAWLPASSALLEMMIFHLPSPHTAQRYRVEKLYQGPLDDQYANAIRTCDPEGPLMLYVSKMIPSSYRGRCFAFGRVFSGKVSTGMKLRIMCPNYVVGEAMDLGTPSIQRTVILMGKRLETVEDVPCGNTVVVVGPDVFISKNATLTNEKEVDAHPIRAMKFTSNDLRRIMDRKHNIRNMSIVAHVNHGKSTLTNCLVAAAGIIPQDVVLEDYAKLGITIKSTGISLYYEMSDASLKSFEGESNGNEYLINLVDSPGHVDFSAEVTAALRITDGALVVVDCVEGVCLQTETVLRQALEERVRPVLAISKMDRCFLELRLDGEKAYQTFQRVIENANKIMAAFQDPLLSEFKVCPKKGTVAFSAGLHGWAFTLKSFAKMHASIFGLDESKMMERLWGNNFFDPQTKKWTKKSTKTATCKRGFELLCYEPIKKVITFCMKNQKDELGLLLSKLGVTVKLEGNDLIGEALMKHVMQAWLPASSALLEMMIFHLPAPHTAQRYRVEKLYQGPLDDQYANAIRNCDPEGPLMLYVSKMIPSSYRGRCFAFGRVFSGKVSTGMKLRIMCPNYVVGEAMHLGTPSIQRTVILMGKRLATVEDVPCGNTVAVFGPDMLITKNATLTNEKELDAYPIRAMKFFVSPVVRVAVRALNFYDIGMLNQGIHLLWTSDPLLDCLFDIRDTWVFTLAGAGELHLDICIEQLMVYIEGISVGVTEPLVSYRETVLQESTYNVMSKSPNTRNRIYMRARPLGIEVIEAIDDGRLGDDPVVRARNLVEQFGWDRESAKKIWTLGPRNTGPNMVVDMCHGQRRFLNEIQGQVVCDFQSASKEGPLASEEMRGISFVITLANIDHDASYRDSSEISQLVSRVTSAAELTAKPRLMEPVYLVGIKAPRKALEGIHSVLKQIRGRVFEAINMSGTGLYSIKAYLPVAESFGLSDKLSAATYGLAVPQCVFDHWEIMESDPFEPGTQAANIVANIRMFKGLQPLPPRQQFVDQFQDY